MPAFMTVVLNSMNTIVPATNTMASDSMASRPRMWLRRLWADTAFLLLSGRRLLVVILPGYKEFERRLLLYCQAKAERVGFVLDCRFAHRGHVDGAFTLQLSAHHLIFGAQLGYGFHAGDTVVPVGYVNHQQCQNQHSLHHVAAEEVARHKTAVSNSLGGLAELLSALLCEFAESFSHRFFL